MPPTAADAVTKKPRRDSMGRIVLHPGSFGGRIRRNSEGGMNRIATFVLVGYDGAGVCAPRTLAHHSAAAFDTQKEVRATGTVTEFSFRNPHVYLVLQVKKT